MQHLLYMYLDTSHQTAETISHMSILLNKLETTGDVVVRNQRICPNMRDAIRIEMMASDWACNFFEYLTQCDIAIVADHPLD